MKIRVVSDVHTEMHPDYGWAWVQGQDPTDVDVLVVAGDLGTAQTIPYVLEGLCLKYPQVVYVNGNHELYGSSFDKVAALRKELTGKTPNLHWLQNSEVTLGGQRFVGTTMWFRDSPMAQMYKGYLNDFRQIGDRFAKRVFEENRKAVKFLQANVREGDVVVTHHLPTGQHIAPWFLTSPLNVYYVCEMEGTIMAKKPAFWFHGHSHDSKDYQLGATRVFSNPFGYMGHDLNPNHDPRLVLTV